MRLRLLNLLFPPRCPFCDGIATDGVCEFCRRKVTVVTEPFCMKCGKPLADNVREYCEDCDKTGHSFESGRALLVYDDVVRHSIYRFKYASRKEYAKVYARMMGQNFKQYIARISPDMLIPVPLHKRRMKKRGYNQAQLVAKCLEKEWGIPCRDDLVRRVKHTRPQKELDRAERQNNLKKAFKIIENDVKLKTIILIDDIYTTGSTMDALAEALLQNGAAKVYFVAIAIGE